MGKDDKNLPHCGIKPGNGATIYLSSAGDWIFDEKKGEARMKRKYGKFTRPVYTMEIDPETGNPKDGNEPPYTQTITL